mmetsp:Transcript_31534/g.69483  ORF Transcript_31534/g.69483 Transcript_31534/m.69483 type:complete len:288 (+) Transcript_31534:187-1050(+)
MRGSCSMKRERMPTLRTVGSSAQGTPTPPMLKIVKANSFTLQECTSSCCFCSNALCRGCESTPHVTFICLRAPRMALMSRILRLSCTDRIARYTSDTRCASLRSLGEPPIDRYADFAEKKIEGPGAPPDTGNFLSPPRRSSPHSALENSPWPVMRAALAKKLFSHTPSSVVNCASREASEPLEYPKDLGLPPLPPPPRGPGATKPKLSLARKKSALEAERGLMRGSWRVTLCTMMARVWGSSRSAESFSLQREFRSMPSFTWFSSHTGMCTMVASNRGHRPHSLRSE